MRLHHALVERMSIPERQQFLTRVDKAAEHGVGRVTAVFPLLFGDADVATESGAALRCMSLGPAEGDDALAAAKHLRDIAGQNKTARVRVPLERAGRGQRPAAETAALPGLSAASS